MIERAIGWLESGGRAVLRGSKKQSRCRRHLHSAFWSHGAGNIDLPSWWMLFLQNPSSARNSRQNRAHRTATAALSSDLQEIFFDFLYPAHTLALIRRLKRSTNAQRHAAQNIKQCSRSYTSIAADFINGAKAFGTTIQSQNRDFSSTSSSEIPPSDDPIRRRINEMMDLKDHTWIYDELWQSYQALLETSQSLSPQELIKMLRCLENSRRTIDIERAVALFDSIPTQQRQAIHYSYAVSAALSLKDLDTAVDIHCEALARTSGSDGTAAAVFRYAVQHEKWQVAINTWHVYWNDKLHSYTMPDIWTGVKSLPMTELIEKAIAAVDFAISTAESSQHPNAVAARDFALELIRKTFSIKNTDFDTRKHWQLVQKARALDASDLKTQTMALKQLLSFESKQYGHRALDLYRVLRKESTYTPNLHLLSIITSKLVAEKSDTDMVMIIKDWHVYHQKLPPNIAIEIARVFADLGQLEPLQNLFQDHCSTYGKPSEKLWYQILLSVHQRRADPEGVVRAFDDLRQNYPFDPGVSSHNWVIGTFCRTGDVDGALGWMHKLLESGHTPDRLTYILLMSLYAKRGDSEAVLDLYLRSKKHRVKPNMKMIDSLVLAHIKDEKLAEAEQLVKEALQMDVKGSRTFMWTILLNAYALRKDIGKVSELHKEMQTSGVASDSMTYAALMTSLSVAKMPQEAHKILNKVMPRAQIGATSIHYAIVMGGYLAIKHYGRVFKVYKEMLTRNLSPTMSTQNILLRAAASVDKTSQDPRQDPEIQTGLVRAQETFEHTISNLDRSELAAFEPRKFVGPNSLNEAFVSTYHEYLIFLHGKDGAFEHVAELYDRYVSTFARFTGGDAKASPPIGLLSALMAAHVRADDHEEVERCWNLALSKSEKLACRANAVTSEPGWVLHSRRLIMNVPLRHYIMSLSKQGRIDDLISIIKQLNFSGFVLNGPNWNFYIEHLARSPQSSHQLLAFEHCERELIPNWPGWDALGNPEWAFKKYRTKVRGAWLLQNRSVPAYVTLVTLAAVYLEARKGNNPTPCPQYAQVAPKTVDAILKMPNMADRYQISLLRGG
ncbi:hypothetical protein BDR22DRAFT_460243 [Usnea florida]